MKTILNFFLGNCSEVGVWMLMLVALELRLLQHEMKLVLIFFLIISYVLVKTMVRIRS